MISVYSTLLQMLMLVRFPEKEAVFPFQRWEDGSCPTAAHCTPVPSLLAATRVTYSRCPMANTDLPSSDIAFIGQELHADHGSICSFLFGPPSCIQLHSSPSPNGPRSPSRFWLRSGLLAGVPASALENFVR